MCFLPICWWFFFAKILLFELMPIKQFVHIFALRILFSNSSRNSPPPNKGGWFKWTTVCSQCNKKDNKWKVNWIPKQGLQTLRVRKLVVTCDVASRKRANTYVQCLFALNIIIWCMLFLLIFCLPFASLSKFSQIFLLVIKLMMSQFKTSFKQCRRLRVKHFWIGPRLVLQCGARTYVWISSNEL
jgi:hypothetical protein